MCTLLEEMPQTPVNRLGVLYKVSIGKKCIRIADRTKKNLIKRPLSGQTTVQCFVQECFHIHLLRD
jgi:hypothetical protein